MKGLIIAIVVIGLSAVVIGCGNVQSPGGAVRVVYERRPTIMEVAPQDMHQTFLQQYHLNPDKRFVGAFLYLVQEYKRRASLKALKLDMQLPETDKNPLILILKKGNNEVGRVQLLIPLTFSSVVDGLDQWVNLLNEIGSPFKQKGTADPEKLKIADTEINYVDQRKIISGLVDLEEMWQDTHDPLLLKSAVRAYGLLLLGLIPDMMGESDALASNALAYLAIARNMDPDLALDQEEALLAVSMDYRKHAEQILENAPVSPGYTDKCLRAFLKDDFNQLKEINKQEWHILGHYLLARTYRHLDLYKQAETVLEKLFKLFPACYPTMVELIYASSVGRSKVLTYVFPLELLRMMEVSLEKEPDFESQTWLDRVSAVGGESGAGISMSGFEDMLQKWEPLSGKAREGFLISTDRVKSMFRILYANSLHLRFNLLFNQWSVLDKTKVFVDNLLKEDAGHPLVMSMQARVLGGLGQPLQAQTVAQKMLFREDCPAEIATIMYYTVYDLLAKVKLLPTLVGRMDSRPVYSHYLAYFLQARYYYDQAVDLYRQVLAANPYYYGAYTNLAQVSGSDQPILEAVEAMGNNYAILAEAGEHFAEDNTPDNLERALACYDKAISLLPDNYYLYQHKAVILRKLGNYQEAIDTVRPFVGEFKDLTDVFVRSNMARTYLTMGDTKKALAIMDNAADSYQGGAMMLTAEIYTAAGETNKAQVLIERAVERYPNASWLLSQAAAFYWRNGQSEKAVRLIAQGAKVTDKFSTWFFSDFFEVFAKQPQDNILQTINLLQTAGISNWQISALAHRFAWYERYDVAMKIMSLVKENNLMTRLEHLVSSYTILRQWKGDQTATAWLKKQIPKSRRAMASITMIKEGEFDLIQDFVEPGKVPRQHQEFCWLIRLIAWLGMDKQPASSAAEFDKHYQKEPTDYYFNIGLYLLGKKEESALLGLIKEDKQRCEFAYYIGLKYRLEGDFRRAADWYAICTETLLENNGEYHWASNELFWWAKMGIERRHRLLKDDLDLGHKEDLLKAASFEF